MEKQKSPYAVGTAVTLACCAVGTAAALVLFSQPGFHEQTDEFFRQAIDFFVKLWNTMPWGFVILGCALAVPLLGLLALPYWDILTRRAPGGSFFYDRARPCLEINAGLRFLPAFLIIIYFVIAAFMQESDSGMSFDPASYIPFAESYAPGEILNFVFVTLTLFSLLLVISDGIISAGPWGMLLHIPVILAANVFLAVLMTGIMFVCVTLLGFIGKMLMTAIALGILIGAYVLSPRTNTIIIKK